MKLVFLIIILIITLIFLYYPLIDNYTVLQHPFGSNNCKGLYTLIYTKDTFNKLINGKAKLYRLNYVLPPKCKQYFGAADPFIFKNHIFCELLDEKGKGIIAVAKFNPKKPIRFKIIITENFHLSYPMIFEENNNIYMIPESYQSGYIKLYKCVNFPFNWKFEKNIIKLPGIDTNIIYGNNEVLLLTNSCKNSKFHVFKSKSISDPFYEVRTNIPQISRGGGSIINNRYLPRQKNITHYTQYIDIYDIYSWKKIKTLRLPRFKFLGTHHISQDRYSKIIVMDMIEFRNNLLSSIFYICSDIVKNKIFLK